MVKAKKWCFIIAFTVKHDEKNGLRLIYGKESYLTFLDIAMYKNHFFYIKWFKQNLNEISYAIFADK